MWNVQFVADIILKVGTMMSTFNIGRARIYTVDSKNSNLAVLCCNYNSFSIQGGVKDYTSNLMGSLTNMEVRCKKCYQ